MRRTASVGIKARSLKTHPHVAATYRVLQRDDRTHGVEVSIPETLPTLVTGFASREAAESWAAAHKRQTDQSVASGRQPFRLARKTWAKPPPAAPEAPGPEAPEPA